MDIDVFNGYWRYDLCFEDSTSMIDTWFVKEEQITSFDYFLR